MIEVKNVSKMYGEKMILNDVSVSFPKGKITCLVGGNGTGKSTLLSIISRLVAKDSGVINLLDKDIVNFKNRDFAKRLSILKQANHPNVRLTVKELVEFGRFPHSQGRMNALDKEKVLESIAFMGLTDIQDQYIDELSGGQRQRTFLAMVLAQDTEYILLDEPLNNLDMKHSVEIMKILRVLADDYGKTIIIVVHDINYASSYADYIAAVKDHKIIHFGLTDDIIREDIMKEVFDIDMTIVDNCNNKVCIYFK
ncbi:ATP-binding cassette domain-containing protein [Myroides marinus]|uniref:iron ABC transporter ATP-binding protein n=1 Tax=Myroides marinus TaxID=703342 RepID=UPI002577FB84|nr:ATP-binding cassette domain-containing protein [Myroides marinus]MDM1351413.1 ATP-binding cassette domain-containing protein [Myroides marinus]MDM1358620.1 ATP-binding cassette domain-containing protein [Myroides marinus]MDM1364509.1 ATP-binding cassette domain-containing protein [Myroides marinus]MDM1369000.1 ATP-binding cassette domain-containing protein [Myroides marinus]MDM1372768.1 ATP-binding cassette domain-containing protein [Myroides marinus]